MYLSDAITARAATDTGARDPDSLLGCLLFMEARGTEKALAKLIKSRSVTTLLDKARAGEAGRVEAFLGDEFRSAPLADPDGLLPSKWKRDLVAMMLRPDGALTSDVNDVLAETGLGFEVHEVMKMLRRDLKDLGVAVHAERMDRVNAFRFRITGNDAWRMQKIISNGWSL